MKSAVESATRRALASGALQPIETESLVVPDSGVEFVVRVVSSLERKAAARKRAYYEITQDRNRAYPLSFLADSGLLPAYQFPTDTFSLDPGVDDTPTLFRPAAIALEEFAPGNYVYANNHKLKTIRAIFAGTRGPRGPD